MANARKIALNALLEVEQSGAYSNLTFGKILSNFSDVSKADKALAGSLFYGVLDRKITLDYILSHLVKTPINKLNSYTLCVLRIALYQIAFLDKIPQSAAVNEAVKLMKNSKQSYQSGFVNAVLRNFIRTPVSLPNGNTVSDLSVRYSCPQWITQTFINGYGLDTTLSLLEESLKAPSVYLRVNTIKTTPQDLCEQLNQSGISACLTQTENAIKVSGGIDIANSPLFNQGLFHIQDLSSQKCVQLLGVKPQENILDICAAPGGKTFTIAQNLNNTGAVYACDLYEHRVKLIESGAKRLGLNNIKTFTLDAQNAFDFDIRFDAVLCDVPCSGLGIIRRKPDIKYKTELDMEKLYKTQLDILTNAARVLKKGGRIVYSTCTLNIAENRGIVDKFLRINPSAKLVTEHTYMPHIDNTDGFYTALIEF